MGFSLPRWQYWVPGLGQYLVLKNLYNYFTPNKPVPGRPPQSSAYGRVVPVVYGRTRVTASVICLEDWTASWSVPVLQGAVCEGPIAGFGRVWKAQDTNAAPSGFGLTTSLGTRPTQTAWTALPSAQQLGYPGVAWIGGNIFVAGQALAQYSFEVKGLLHATGDATNGDADPSQILSGTDSMLTNTAHGAGLPITVIVATGRDGTAASSYARFVGQVGMWISPAFTERQALREHVQEVLDTTNATCLATDGGLEIVPLGDATVGTFVPELSVRYALTPDHLLAGGGGDRVEVERPPPGDGYNVVPVEFLDRSPAAAATDPGNSYNASIVDEIEPVDVALRGERRAPVISAHSVCLRSVATQLARVNVQRAVRAQARFRFRLPWTFARLQPLDIVTLTDPLLGLSDRPVRIERISEDPDTLELDIEGVEWNTGVWSATSGDRESSQGVIPQTVTVAPTWGSAVALSPATATTGTVTVTASGGPGSYSYAWEKVSGDTVTVTSPTAAATTFSRSSVGYVVGVYRCKVTSGAVSVYTENVTIELEVWV